MNTAIIVAAGSGKRFGSNTPKQFLEIDGKPIIIHTLERFQTCNLVDRIVLVLPSEDASSKPEIHNKYGISKLSEIVVGGKSRAESVLNGFRTIDASGASIIAVHDGARPLVRVDEIACCIEKAEQSGAAILVAPVTDTIKEIENGEIVQTVDRNTLRRALTPQCFRYDVLEKAFSQSASISDSATDESFLVERLGVRVAVVEGSSRNIKITTKEDFILAERLLKENV